MIKVLVFKASDDDYKEFITFETLEDFFKYVDNVGHRIIVSKNFFKRKYPDCKYEITIYDGYVE